MDEVIFGVIISIGICLFYVIIIKCICPSQEDILDVEEEEDYIEQQGQSNV